MNTDEITKLTHLAADKLKGGDARSALLLSRQAMQNGNATVPLLEIHAQAALHVGDLGSAISAMEKVIQAGGATAERAIFYGDLLLRAKRWQAAANIFQQIVQQQDSNTTAWLGLAHCLLGSGDVTRAAQAYGAVLERDPDHFDANFKLATCKLYMGDARSAIALLDKINAQHSGSAELAFYYGEALRRAGRIEDAIAIFLPQRHDKEWGEKIQKGLIMAWLSTEQFDEAIPVLEKLLKKAPEDPELLGFKARVLSIEGKQDESMRLAKQILDANEDSDAVWELYTGLLKEPMETAYFDRLLARQEHAKQTNEERSLASLHFAAAKHFNLSGESEKEIEQIDRANALMAKLEPFDSKRHGENVARCRRSYTADAVDALSTSIEQLAPVFILCPPRSGSTLLEQALARHSAFQAGGEMNFSGDAWYELTGNRTITLQPELHEAITAEQVEQFAKAYLAAMRAGGYQDKGFLVHKGINNHKVAGLLKASFPRARFIDLRRDPMDVAFGCYRQNFESQKFSFTADGCAAEIKLFQQNMEWWYQQMPEAIRQVRYQDLVEDFEGQIRALLDWLGLEWEDACVDFKRKSRVVTASANQVRQGVFKQGVGRWKKYEDYLGPLVEALERHGVELQ